ncbi:Ada metal-binding domain-containing protein [Dyadobacter luticola]|uniref:Metal-binding protein n=1 Tax=Dyadobacter luticola TaxID=1979387 RepID=A0A5R9L330_9BACT|nr:Ada metal-binding domain-containing protein [Dyadobacter luticola]TLV02984.1 metal-binding protein [Dyadobacter luticola]
MIQHSQLGPPTFGTSRKLKKLIDKKRICFGGNKNLKIYGRLDCSSGKRMKFQNRVFFESEKDALGNGYRPCGLCMREEYKKWKQNLG